MAWLKLQLGNCVCVCVWGGWTYLYFFKRFPGTHAASFQSASFQTTIILWENDENMTTTCYKQWLRVNGLCWIAHRLHFPSQRCLFLLGEELAHTWELIGHLMLMGHVSSSSLLVVPSVTHMCSMLLWQQVEQWPPQQHQQHSRLAGQYLVHRLCIYSTLVISWSWTSVMLLEFAESLHQ
jgi:hypothetical protein